MTTINFEIERLEGRGITAKVINAVKVYSTYTAFAKASGYPDAVGKLWTVSEDEKQENARLLHGKTVNVLAKGKHGSHGGTIYVVESEDGERFLFGKDGLEIIEKGDGGMKQIDEMITQVGEIIHKAYAKGYEAGKIDMAFEITQEAGKKIAKELRRIKETPQQARDRIVEQAKADVTGILGKYEEFYVTIGGYENQAVVAKFHVNAAKRTVVALIYGKYSGKLYEKGIAKCAPGDCFNVHIGKAIALRRALGLEVPDEYLNAPQPTEVRVGDVVKYPNGRIVEILEKDFFDVNRVKEVSTGDISSATTFELTKIIDDSREGVSE